MTDELAWETLDSRTSYTCEGFDIVTDTVCFPSGEEAEFDYLSEGESVVVLPFTADGDVVAIEQWRQPVGRVNWALPAGGMEPEDTDPEDCVARELEEETGYRPRSVEHLTTVEPTNGFADAVFHYFVARDCEPTGEQDLDYNEDIRVETTTFDALVDAARQDELRDGRSMLGVLYFALFGEIEL
ncbi:NUDIX hydrolase [Halosimplex aquaticum]|uniref:NUDIX hydrolase n=1 Tax=Halosimplex aquaticum TaxID=3026162 RepID=A0ABD5Y1A2_9EURY|nr:NUDIX hydrolase [Halosimplex aquaticum]